MYYSLETHMRGVQMAGTMREGKRLLGKNRNLIYWEIVLA